MLVVDQELFQLQFYIQYFFEWYYLQLAKTTKYNQAVSEKDTLVANLVDPTTDASIVYISMLDDRLLELEQEINSASTQQQLDAIDFNFPVFDS